MKAQQGATLPFGDEQQFGGGVVAVGGSEGEGGLVPLANTSCVMGSLAICM